MLWEEKKYIKQKRTNMTPNLNGSGNGITEMPRELRKHEWKIIGGRKAWKKRKNVKFDPSHVQLTRLDMNPRSFKKYIDDM